jgi:hypothetical protein
MPGPDYPEIEFMKAELGPILIQSVAWERTWATIFGRMGFSHPVLGNHRWQPKPSSNGGIVYDDGYGLVSICVEFKVDRVRAAEFVHIMREVRLPSTYRLEITVTSWNEHLIQFRAHDEIRQGFFGNGLELSHRRNLASRKDLFVAE